MQASILLRGISPLLVALYVVLPGPALAQRRHHQHHRKVAAPVRAHEPENAAQWGTAEPPEKQLPLLARALRDQGSAATYARLSEFANSNSESELGARAALALGYYDFSKRRLQQAQQWLEKAQRDSLLRECTLYWRAQTSRAQGRNAEALAQLEAFRQEFPESAMTEQAVQSLAETALSLGKADRAVEVLEAYEKTAAKPALLLLRARAREKAHATAAAARDYLTVYYHFPLEDEAKDAGKRIPALARALGAEFPDVPMGRKLGRAGAFFSAHKWREARTEYERLLPQLRKTSATADLERAELRLAQIKVEHKGSPRLLASLKLTDPEIDAERLYALSQAYRSKKKEAEMLEAIEQVTSRYPQSRWAEESLFAEANYFWVNLDRKRAASYYQRWLEQFPGWKNSLVAHWRVAWVAHLERRPEATALQEEHLRKFPGSQFTANALYWLGRGAERGGNIPHARSFYQKLQERYPQTYFGRQAAERLRPEPEGIGDGPVNPSDVLALIPPPLPIPQMEEGIPAAAQERWTRVQALRSIAFDSSAELELRAAYTATGSLRLLWETAQSAIDAGHYSVGMATTRQAFPQLEARKIEDVPLPVWHTFFPLPFEEGLRRTAARHGLDPMLVAALIRQESTFQPDALSHVGAIGLMQVLPRTAKKLARRLKLRYSRAKLFDPEYNLQLGTLYLADLMREFGKPEAALAAFNAGEDRVAAWRAERDYEETAEFVESIPFTETREYVQIIMRNAEVYRRLYGQTPR